MNIKLKKLTFLSRQQLICVGILSALCTTSIPAFATDKDWLSEEVLIQLQEIRREIKAMRNDIQQLRGDVSKIQDAGLGNKNTKVSKVFLGSKQRLGDENAKIAIVEFSDFQCPFCSRHVKNTMPKIQKNYIDSGQVQYVMRDFPLSFHRQAKAAAIAANCAGKQGKYWKVHDDFFKNKGVFKRERYIALAKKLQLDEGKYVACLDDPKVATAVDDDVSYGGSIGVTGTPAFFIGKLDGGEITNVISISGARPYATFQKIIDSLSSKK